MSIQRYTFVGFDPDDIETNVNGEYVKYSDHFKRIEELETNVHSVMKENMELTVKVLEFERVIQEIREII